MCTREREREGGGERMTIHATHLNIRCPLPNFPSLPTLLDVRPPMYITTREVLNGLGAYSLEIPLAAVSFRVRPRRS